jgi:hypothetical protein
MFFAGLALNKPPECGYFELEASTGTVRTLRAAAPGDCRKGLGPISPDGKRAVSENGAKAGLLDLETGAFQFVKGLGGAVYCNWSPDGSRFACSRGGKIAVVDVGTLRLRSPDGKNLLVQRYQLSCLGTLYFESLAVLDVETGKRRWVKSAHCNVSGGFWGWVDREALR